jgi:hypothetical protein
LIAAVAEGIFLVGILITQLNRPTESDKPVGRIYGSAYYALKAICEANRANAEFKTNKERRWQSRQLTENLRDEIMSRAIILKDRGRILIRIKRDRSF